MATVVIISSSNDIHALAVQEKLSEITNGSANCIILDFATFPIAADLTVAVDQGILSSRLGFVKPLPDPYSSNARELLESRIPNHINTEDLRAVWWRRPRLPIPPKYVGSIFQDYSVQNTRDFLLSYFTSLGKQIRIVNGPFAESKADRKLLQIELASACGLKAPQTLFTNDPEQARRFIDLQITQGRRVIFKQLTSEAMQVNHFTTELTQYDQKRLKAIRGTPIIFQEKIEGGFDVRIVVIGKTTFAMAQQAEEPSTSDIRKEEKVKSWVVYIPRDIEKSLLTLHKELGLHFGAYDFKVDKDGGWYFLEVNPSGQWLYMETLTGTPLAEAFAYYLWYGKVDKKNLKGTPYSTDSLNNLLGFLDDIMKRAESTIPTLSMVL